MHLRAAHGKILCPDEAGLRQCESFQQPCVVGGHAMVSGRLLSGDFMHVRRHFALGGFKACHHSPHTVVQRGQRMLRGSSAEEVIIVAYRAISESTRKRVGVAGPGKEA